MKGYRSVSGVVVVALLFYGCGLTTEPSVYEDRLDTMPSWSNDGATVAFSGMYSGAQGIYLVDTAGTNLRLLVAGVVNGGSWSPDSKWLAFAGSDGIYKVKVNGDSITRLTNSFLDYHPAWSFDGRKIAFVRQTVGVMIYDLQTQTANVVFESGLSPSWHPNGELIVFGGAGGTQAATYTFYAVRDSGNWRTLVSFSSTDQCGYSSVSPVGSSEQTISYSASPLNKYTQVWKIDVAGSIRTQLTTDGGDGASWSPDGTRLVYTRTQQGDGGLWIMKSDGTGKHRLTNPSQR